MKTGSLISCTHVFLNLVINLYNSGNIDYETFIDISKVKFKFLEDILKNTYYLKEKDEIMLTLKKYKTICYYQESVFSTSKLK
jgi:hypothetical protein